MKAFDILHTIRLQTLRKMERREYTNDHMAELARLIFCESTHLQDDLVIYKA